jgi:hypothetical protein
VKDIDLFLAKYSDDQPRAENGEWEGGGGGRQSAQSSLDRWNNGGRRNAEIMYGKDHPKIAAHERKLKDAAAKEKARSSKSYDNRSNAMGLNLFVPITKIDVARREVWGRLAHEVPDRSGEIFDYAGSKPYFKAWSEGFAKATDGKSLGNMRAMHGKTAAGKFIAVNFNDAEKAIDVGGKVVDDAEWAKVEEGVYTGFSIGGSYVGEKIAEKIDGKDYKRYIADPAEGSLVDSPCIPTAKFFDVVKADGVVEKKAFKVADTEYKIEGTEEQIEQFAKDMATNGLTMADVLDMIAKAADAKKKKGEKPGDKADDKEPDDDADDTAKVMVAFARAGTLAKTLADPELLLVDLMKLADAELSDDERKGLKTPEAVKSAIIAKAGRFTAAHADKMQAIHDHSASMGATCGADKAAKPDDLAKSADVAALQKSVDELKEKVKKYESQPVPHVMLRAVTKQVAGDPATTTATKLADIPLYPELTKADHVYNGDGSVDYVTSYAQKRYKLAAAAAA